MAGGTSRPRSRRRQTAARLEKAALLAVLGHLQRLGRVLPRVLLVYQRTPELLERPPGFGERASIDLLPQASKERRLVPLEAELAQRSDNSRYAQPVVRARVQVVHLPPEDLGIAVQTSGLLVHQLQAKEPEDEAVAADDALGGRRVSADGGGALLAERPGVKVHAGILEHRKEPLDVAMVLLEQVKVTVPASVLPRSVDDVDELAVGLRLDLVAVEPQVGIRAIGTFARAAAPKEHAQRRAIHG
eukprot:CAMPEP_0197887942 /NCGR_PEP_ID=MMETSP1439-20131203/20215_1 /TAXON_ID=66791 /ORGANISM="Gonyaulax spinifera, Strain CCMP409" /LENGTH=244 /DNA_ID=CAMNT_0043507813 /DNA_START=19 /DNA_END=753 /DNA_ORIENTATION=+